MAVDQTPDPLERATRALRDDSGEGWVEVSQAVMERVRTLVTPAASVLTFDERGSADRGPRSSTIRVSGRILTPQVRDAVDTASRAADSIDIVVVDDRCTTIRIDLVCAYGVDLQHEGSSVRAAVRQVVELLVGDDPLFDPERDIEVAVVDVVAGDPRTA